MSQADGMQQVEAEAPMAEMFKYATDLRSMTQARGSFTMEFARYEVFPPTWPRRLLLPPRKMRRRTNNFPQSTRRVPTWERALFLLKQRSLSGLCFGPWKIHRLYG